MESKKKTTSNVLPSPRSNYDLTRDHLDNEFHDPYIITGYRKPNLSITESVKSAFVLSCNESFNILSHFVAFSYLGVKYYKIFTGELAYTNSINWPLICQCIGILGFCLMSSLAHTFNSMSKQARNRCFFFDYAAISIYSVGAGLAFYFYTRPFENEHTATLFSDPTKFICLSIITSIASTFLCCQSRTKWTSVKYIVRTIAYVIPFVVNSLPYFYRLAFCDNETDCDNTNLSVYLKHGLYMALASVANVSKIPERFVPRKFDAIGQSHHIMHILFPIACDIQFEFLRLEMELKHKAILQNPVQANINNVVVPMIIAIVVNLLISALSNSGPQTTVTERKSDAHLKKMD